MNSNKILIGILGYHLTFAAVGFALLKELNPKPGIIEAIFFFGGIAITISAFFISDKESEADNNLPGAEDQE